MDILDTLLADRALDPTLKQLRYNRWMLEQGDDAVGIAVDTIRDSTSELRAFYAAVFLSRVPGHEDAKNAAIDGILEPRPQWLNAIASLVEFADEANVDRLARYAIGNPQAPGALSIAYELAQHFPEKMRPSRKELAPFDVEELLMPGAPDDWVADLLAKYRKDRSPRWLVMISYVRTDAARSVLIDVLNSTSSGGRAFVEALVESVGVFPDTRLASTYDPPARGFAVEPSRSPHAIDGDLPRRVPIGPVDKRPAEKILELSKDDLPFKAGGEGNPLLYWYEGSLPPSYLYVRNAKDGLEAMMTPMGEPSPGYKAEIVMGAASALLVEERHPFGIGGMAFAGDGRIQVGGYPHWRNPERFPRCPTCSQGMRFTASVSSGVSGPVLFAFKGIVYGFWCETCGVSCTLRQI